MHQSEGLIACTKSKYLLMGAGHLGMFALFLSFFAFIPPFDTLSLVPLLRQFHQATKHTVIGDIDEGIPPPRMLYMTDGGVRECTSLMGLFQRRTQRILMSHSGWDPDSDMTT